ncbi:hypothetical protein [Qipengyuania vesicularis]|uniref:hypothetical protein n=1 Tax=Qipengyuania vesicularis TaxID=2867232 RepID=UPI001C87491C|nr:hypothetical protein [Qipengyuania vesicularis]MBX7526621.1 hypothetical protein [Qipengyuania vesicularis]
MIARTATYALFLGGSLSACSPVADADPDREELLATVEAAASPDPAENCLLMVWSGQEEPDVEFDRAHDSVEGGAISCATGTSPSQFEAAISALRDAAQSGNKARVLEQIGIPLLYIDSTGERRELSEDQVEELFDEVFDDRVMDMLQRLDLSQMTVERDQGAFFELGSLWLVVDDTGRPRVMTVNRQALEEAAIAARDQTERGEGKPID